MHKKVFSVRALEGPDKGRVIKHTPYVHLDNPKFVVQQGGRQRVLREKRKNVHAFVRGELLSTSAGKPSKLDMQLVTYNPYKYDSFVRLQGCEPIKEAKYALLEDRYIWVDKDE